MNSTPGSHAQAEALYLAPKRRNRVRPSRVEGDLAFIPLTQGYEAVVDVADLPLVAGFNWSASVSPWAVYAVRSDCSGKKPRTVRMHRVLMGEPEGLDVDHEDRNGLNNRRKNLRVASTEENARNQGVRKTNSSGHKGVSFHSRDDRWQAQIRANGQQHFLGYFPSADAAASAYAEASAKLHGDFGRIS